MSNGTISLTMWPPDCPPVAVIGHRYSAAMRSSTPRVARASQITNGGGSPPQQSMRASSALSATYSGAIAPRTDVAALVQYPRPRHKAKLAQPHGRVADVLRRRARALVAAGIAIGFRH